MRFDRLEADRTTGILPVEWPTGCSSRQAGSLSYGPHGEHCFAPILLELLKRAADQPLEAGYGRHFRGFGNSVTVHRPAAQQRGDGTCVDRRCIGA